MTLKFGKIFLPYDLSYDSVEVIMTLKEMKINRANSKETITQKKTRFFSALQ